MKLSLYEIYNTRKPHPSSNNNYGSEKQEMTDSPFLFKR